MSEKSILQASKTKIQFSPFCSLLHGKWSFPTLGMPRTPYDVITALWAGLSQPPSSSVFFLSDSTHSRCMVPYRKSFLFNSQLFHQTCGTPLGRPATGLLFYRCRMPLPGLPYTPLLVLLGAFLHPLMLCPVTRSCQFSTLVDWLSRILLLPPLGTALERPTVLFVPQWYEWENMVAFDQK